MFERELRLHGLMFGLLRQLLADADDSQLGVPFCQGGNPPSFTLGHLAVTNDYALRYFGEPRIAPAEWHKRFRPGAAPKDDDSPLPTKAELLRILEAGHERLLAAAPIADPGRMNQPQNSDFFNGTPVETIGDVVAHLLTSHMAFHLGQISAWRRLQGRLPLF